ncbi:MAG: GNAT family N-acetyltransferase, partial [Gemmatimonadota bacterium]|nr:GNAT family N-acetyltransferase [Gemmatimonadota bacterium]
IDSSRASFAGEGWGLWAVRLSDSDVVAGFAGFRHFFDPPEVQLLYGLAPDFWGRGLATEAARAVVDYAFEQLDFEVVVAATDVPNVSSVRVMERLGMTFDRATDEGEHGTVYYRLTSASARRGET